jgi:UDP-N-acetylglucosamine--N-acetylmuramyl-(pentapeptide) pyrophosphoryl-undecaprenol N-acetylglucosamine transferase
VTSIVVAAGGTGGHIYPGLAVARALRTLDPSVEITFVGTPRGLEQRLIQDYPLVMVDMVPWRGARRAPGFAFATVRATLQALRRVRPDAVVAMGGYPSLPMVIAAWLRRVPVVIHESGATAGRANRLAAKFTKNIAVSFASAKFAGRTPRVTGMPLNAENLNGRVDVYPQPMVFITGGSQGSVRLNELAVGLAQRWTDTHIVLKTGKDNHVESSGVLHAYDYLESIGDAYASADLVVTRAGASTVAELAVWGLPSILVPYPHALDNDQDYNAAVLADVGGAVVVPDADATPDTVGPIIEDLLANRDKLAAMGAAAKTVGHAEAAETLARWVLDLALQ